MKTNRLKSSTKIIIAGVLAVSIIVAGGFVWNSKRNNTTTTPSASTGTTQPNSKANTDAESGDIKQQIINKEETINQQTPSTSSGKKKVTPVITSSSQLSISAYVPGIFEEGGKCTATLTQGGATLRKDSDGFTNVSYTQCAPIDLSTLNFPSKGTWAVTVSYSSSAAEGASKSQNIEVN